MGATHDEYQVVVVGAGSAGVAAAAAAAGNGARTLLVERDTFVGGDLISGLPILGCCNSRGEWIVGGVLDELLEGCKRLEGYLGCICDWRTLWGVCVDPEVLRLVILEVLARHGVELRPGAHLCGAASAGGTATELLLACGGIRTRVRTDLVVDCTGDAAVAAACGAECEQGGPNGEFQPVSWVFQMGPVDFPALLDFVRDHPEEALLAENPVIGTSRADCARALHEAGYPYVALSAGGELLGGAVRSGEMFPCTAIFMSPTSLARREVTLNTTRVANVDATDPRALSAVQGELAAQVRTAVQFAHRQVPGFAEAGLTRLAPRLGVRETRRVVGEHVLTTEEVLEGRKSPQVVARGGHHVDIHGAGTYQKRLPIRNGRSYDIPLGCLIPRGLANVLVAGRCLSSSREANGSARVMGTCLATGQAAGTAAALCVAHGWHDVRDLPVELLQETLRRQGAVLDGTA
ncbi:FAD-dependent oxidoreductase [bacterium]|nr:FAD-dependent oxidoreductase [bacterium]